LANFIETRNRKKGKNGTSRDFGVSNIAVANKEVLEEIKRLRNFRNENEGDGKWNFSSLSGKINQRVLFLYFFY
jgi:hypothetical protein